MDQGPPSVNHGAPNAAPSLGTPAAGPPPAARTRRALVALCITVTTSYGVLFYAFPVLAPAISADTGWSLVRITAAFSAAQVVGGLGGAVVGRWLERVGPRPVMTSGAVAAVPALAGIAAAPDLVVFTGAWMLAGAATACLFYPAAFAAITHWFGPARVRALTTLTLVAGLASTIFAPLTAVLEASLGWRGAYAVLGVLFAAVVIPLHALAPAPPWRRRSASRDAGAVSIGSVVADRPFLMLAAALTLGSFGVYASVVNLVPLLDERGLSTTTAAWALAVGGIGQVLGRLLYAPLERRTGPVSRAAAMLTVCALTTGLLATTAPVAVLMAVALLAGTARGLLTLVQATAISDRWGTERYAALNGVLHTPLVLVIALAPWAGAVLAGPLGGYPALFLLLALAGLAGAALSLGSAPRSRPTP